MKGIGLNSIDGYFDAICNNLLKNRAKTRDLHVALDRIVNRYINAEESIVDSVIGVGISDNNTSNKIDCCKNCEIEEYDIEKIKELMNKKPEDLTEEELLYLMNAILQLDADDMDEFMLASLAAHPYITPLLLSSFSIWYQSE